VAGGGVDRHVIGEVNDGVIREPAEGDDHATFLGRRSRCRTRRSHYVVGDNLPIAASIPLSHKIKHCGRSNGFTDAQIGAERPCTP
jgi:hypothetical protein